MEIHVAMHGLARHSTLHKKRNEKQMDVTFPIQWKFATRVSMEVSN